MTTKRTKILYVASTASHLHRFHQPYIEALRQNADVFLMATEGEGIDFPIPFAKRFFSLRNFISILSIRRILKRERFDRVIVNTTLAAFLIRAAMIGMKDRPYVLNIVHGYLFSEPIAGLRSKILLSCEKLLRRQTDEIVVMNAEDAKIATAHRLCRGELRTIRGMGVTVPIGVPDKDLALRAQYASETGEFLCTFVGELSGRKNQIFLIRAVARLRKEGIPVRLLLPGEGSERAVLEEEIARLNLQNFVFLPGNCEPILPYLGITDLYVSASTSEGLPFNVMEAMSCGLPLLLSDTKGQNDLLSDRSDALYPLNDMDTFCEKLKRIYRARQFGAGSCSYPILEKYRLDAVFEENLCIMTGGEADAELS
ncbi:MAG: glycosyltransferase [Clostridia bacterium]|nr:glycosyltransferase [Clostridia bacterium]